MKDRFSKNHMLKVLETLIIQSQLEYKQRGFGNLTLETTYNEAEEKGTLAIRIHSVCNERVAQKIFIEQWKKQSDDFLRPDLIGTYED